MNADIKEETIK